MSTPNKTAPDFGEPWKTTNYRDGGIVTSYDQPIMEGFKLVKRAVACVNACAGMSDPAAEIEAMREAIKEAHSALTELDQCRILYGDSMAIDNHTTDACATARAKLKTLA